MWTLEMPDMAALLVPLNHHQGRIERTQGHRPERRVHKRAGALLLGGMRGLHHEDSLDGEQDRGGVEQWVRTE
jgi:hypothetical protein